MLALVCSHARALLPPPSSARTLLGIVPADWKRFFHVADVTVGVWLVDFGKRVTQLQELSACGVAQLGRRGVWLGGLFSPEAFVTATRQAVAQQLQCGLESLRMVVTVGEEHVGASTFIIKGACAARRRRLRSCATPPRACLANPAAPPCCTVPQT